MEEYTIDYREIIRRNSAAFIILPIICVIVSLVVLVNTPLEYTAQSLIRTGNFEASEAKILIKSQDIVLPMMEDLNIAERSGGAITTFDEAKTVVQPVIANFLYLGVRATTTDPQLSADIVNYVTNLFVERHPTSLPPSSVAKIDRVKEDITILTELTDTLYSNTTNIFNNDTFSTSELSDETASLSALIQYNQFNTMSIQLTSLSQELEQAYDELDKLLDRDNYVEILELALVPVDADRPLSLSVYLTYAILGLVVGLLLAVGIAMVRE